MSICTLDEFVVRGLGCRGYLRYVDDFALFASGKQQLWSWKEAIVAFLRSLRLIVHENSAQVQPTASGIPWLGFVVYPTHRLLKRRNMLNFARRWACNMTLYRSGTMSFAELDASVQGWINHARYGDTWGLRARLLHA